jgi:hypothetical protein
VTPQEQAKTIRNVVSASFAVPPPYTTAALNALEAGAQALEALATLTNAIAGYPSDTVATDVTYFGVEATHAERMVKRLAVTSPSCAALWQVVARRNRLAEAALHAAANLVEAST